MLKDLREQSGMSQTDFARELGTTQTAISMYENEHWTPTVMFWLRVAKILDLDPKRTVQDAMSRGYVRDKDSYDLIVDSFLKNDFQTR
jgi:transcriptional regulator with XRE-family HTH domain